MTTTLTIRELSKDQMAQSAIAELQANGARVRKVHNVGAYRGRRNQVVKGVADIGGYSRTGVAIECEVKTINDKFSQEQIDRLEDLDKCGGIALVAIQKGNTVALIPWKEAKVMFKLKTSL